MIEQLPVRLPPPRIGTTLSGERAERRLLAAGLTAFAALAALVVWRWTALITSPPAGRAVAAVAVAVIGAALLGALARSASPGALTRAIALVIALATALCGLIAMGLPAHLLAPAGWSELGRDVGSGLSGAVGAGFPYNGTDPWTRMVILFGAPVILGVAAWLAFAPASRPRSRTWPLVTLVAGFAFATAMRPPSQPAIWGLALFAAIAAWLWLGRTAGGGAAPTVALLAAAAALALPFTSALDRNGPLLDYQNWNLSLPNPNSQSIAYSWDQTYGPLHWSRTGKTLMTISGTSQQYWRAAVLERFDGLRWTTAGNAVPARFELPADAERGLSTQSRINALNPQWIHKATVNVDALSSQLVVAPGSILKLSGLAVGSGGPAGVTLPSDDLLGDGDSYTVVAYEPDPSPTDLRTAPQHLNPGLRQYTQLALPTIRHSPIPTDSFGHPLQAGRPPSPTISLKTVKMPLYGASGGSAQRRELAGSDYGRVYDLTRRLTAEKANEYGAVKAIEQHLRTSYSYNESPPQRELPLRAFLFRDRIGYCQQFSGAMALMLRTIGIPARVAAGFSPGVPNPHGNGWAVRDLDAHSWVEVYFDGIGWVPFDPTPAAAPAAAQATGTAPVLKHGEARQLAGQAGGPLALNKQFAPKTGAASSGPPWALVVAVLVAALGLAAVVIVARRRRRFLALPADEGTAAQVRELSELVRRLDLDERAGVTLLELERRLATIAGPVAGSYARALRRVRFGRAAASPPTLHDRRELRRALFGHGGRHRYLAGLFALPPGAPK